MQYIVYYRILVYFLNEFHSNIIIEFSKNDGQVYVKIINMYTMASVNQN